MKDDAKVDGLSDGVDTGQYRCVAGIRTLVLDTRSYRHHPEGDDQQAATYVCQAFWADVRAGSSVHG